MSAVFRATDVPAREREVYWRQVMAEHLAPMELAFDSPPGDDDTLVVGRIGLVTITDIASGPGRARWTAAQARHQDPGLVQLFVQDRGTIVDGHDTDLTPLAPGDLRLVELSRPYQCLHPTVHRSIAVTFPRELMPLPSTAVSQLAGTRIPGAGGPAALASVLVRQLPAHLDDHGVAATRLGTAVIDLLAAALAARLDLTSAVPADVRRRALLTRIHAFVEARLADPGLTPALIAEAHHVSPRYLYRLFQEEGSDQGTSVSGLIRTRRLERCRRDLLDPALAGRSAAAIAGRWGFPDAAHFNRAFRAAFGQPPGRYRRTHGSG